MRRWGGKIFSNRQLGMRVCTKLVMIMMSRGSSVSIVADYGLDDRGSIPDRQRIFLLVPASRPALGPTQLPIQWVPGVLSPGVKRDRRVMLTLTPI
jgi:hypothetical protein